MIDAGRFELHKGEFSLRELRSGFPAGSGENMVVFPPGQHFIHDQQSPSWCPPQTRDEWDALGVLLERLCDPSAWKGHETHRKSDQLRDKHYVHHFHLDERHGSRSTYRWFAFRAPDRFGNVWFNLGGTYEDLESLGHLWTSSVWLRRIKQLYPWVASTYRIRGAHNIPFHSQLPENVKSIWHGKRQGVSGAVRVDDDIYLYPGMASDAPRSSDPDRWMVFGQDGALFAMYGTTDGDVLLSMFDQARATMDCLTAM